MLDLFIIVIFTIIKSILKFLIMFDNKLPYLDYFSIFIRQYKIYLEILQYNKYRKLYLKVFLHEFTFYKNSFFYFFN